MNTTRPLFLAHVAPSPKERSARSICLSGEFDSAGCDTLRRAVAEVGDHDLILDLTRLSFIDAGGLGCLVGLRNFLLSRGRTATLRNAAPRVVRVFDVAGLGELLAVPPPPDPAVASLPDSAASLRAQVGSAPSRSIGRLLWQTTVFTIRAWVSFEPREVHVIAGGDFSAPGAAAVLQGALSRLAQFQAPIVIDSLAVTAASDAVAGIMRVHRGAQHGEPSARICPPTEESLAAASAAARVA